MVANQRHCSDMLLEPVDALSCQQQNLQHSHDICSHISHNPNTSAVDFRIVSHMQETVCEWLIHKKRMLKGTLAVRYA